MRSDIYSRRRPFRLVPVASPDNLESHLQCTPIKYTKKKRDTARKQGFFLCISCFFGGGAQQMTLQVIWTCHGHQAAGRAPTVYVRTIVDFINETRHIMKFQLFYNAQYFIAKNQLTVARNLKKFYYPSAALWPI